jgi:hypothetical protein
VCPSAFVGVTVTVVPSTPTNRKWKTWPVDVGRDAAPHALPCVLEEYDHPIAYASIGEQPLTGSSDPYRVTTPASCSRVFEP